MTGEAFHKPKDAVRFWGRVDDSGDCWVWTRGLNDSGYGNFWLNGMNRKAHRVAYVNLVGPIPAGDVLDHLCRNRACVNPVHLEVVDRAVNAQRGIKSYAIRDQCVKGHDITTPESWYVTTDGRKNCRECIRIRTRRREACSGCGNTYTSMHLHSGRHACKGTTGKEAA